MTPLHPKLNWEEFERLRARRKRRKFFWWFSSALGMLGLLALGVYSFIHQPEPREMVQKAPQTILKNPSQRQPISLAPVNPSQPAAPAGPKQLTVASRKDRPAQTAAKGAPASAAVRKDDKHASAMSVEEPKTPAANALEQEPQEVLAPLPRVPHAPKPAAAPTQEKDSSKVSTVLAGVDSPEVVTGVYTQLPPAKRASVLDSSWSLQLGWMPWHLAEFETSSLAGANSLVYRPLNSFRFGLGVPLYSTTKLKLQVEPQYVWMRFQMQFDGNLQTFQVAPGSVVGYIQDIKGVVPVLADTVEGIAGIGAKQNGSLHELMLPLSLSTTVWSRGNMHVRVQVMAGMHYVFALRGTWFDGSALYALQRPDFRMGVLGGGGLLFSYQPGLLVYQAGVSSLYRGATTDRQLPWRHQLQVSVALPLRKR